MRILPSRLLSDVLFQMVFENSLSIGRKSNENLVVLFPISEGSILLCIRPIGNHILAIQIDCINWNIAKISNETIIIVGNASIHRIFLNKIL
jgi:hypothetical protein